jgi:hypothetical protein
VPERAVHPKAFDFDAIYSRSITEMLTEVRNLKTEEHGVIVIDSITHVWEAARNAYNGRLNKAGQVPFHAWSQIKRPYKELMSLLLSLPIHVFICGRQGNEFEEDEETGEMKKTGVKMKAEGETAYEPHILLRMESVKDKAGVAVITAFAEKDRTGILSGRTIDWPKYDNIIKPLLGLLGDKQAQVKSEDEVGSQDAEALAVADAEKERKSAEHLRRIKAKFDAADTADQVATIAKDITAELKKEMTAQHVAELREKWEEATGRVKKGAA